MDKIILDEAQLAIADHHIKTPRDWDQSDCGVGKTLACIHAYAKGKELGAITGRVLVLCPKTSMQTAWGDDIEKYNYSYNVNLTYNLAYNTCRWEALSSRAEIVIMNHDGIKWVEEHMPEMHGLGFEWLIIDEATAYKNINSQRTKALQMARILFSRRTAISGSAYSKGILECFMPTLIVDDGEHLGVSFYDFRSQICNHKDVHVSDTKKVKQWVEKDNAKDIIVNALADMTVRFPLVLDVHNEEIFYKPELPPKVRLAYDMMKEHGIYTEDDQVAVGINAAVKLNKMLQILTGSIYDSAGNPMLIDCERYEFIIDLICQRDHPCLVMYNWTHELEQLKKHAKKAKLKFEFINSKVSPEKRTKIVRDFQDGKLDAVFAHPRTVAHSLTFTRGEALIWASPPNSPELLWQGNWRINRRGQTKDNQIIYIASKGTKEVEVYRRLRDPLATQRDILAVFTEMSKGLDSDEQTKDAD